MYYWPQYYKIVLQHFSLYFHKIKMIELLSQNKIQFYGEKYCFTEDNTILQRKIQFYRGKYNFKEENENFMILCLFYNIVVMYLKRFYGFTFFYNIDACTRKAKFAF